MARKAYLHHIKRRKKKKDKAWIKWLDKFLIIVAIAGPMSTLPQIYRIFVHKTAHGVSAWSWGIFGLISIPWLVYGLVHKDKPIIISAALWIFLDTIVMIGALVHG